MRYVTVVAYPDNGGINQLDRRVNELGLAYRAIHRMELLADDTVAMFAEGRGDVEGLHRVLSESSEVFEFSISGDEAGFFSYTRYTADDLTRMLMEDWRESSYLIDMPIEYTDDGGLRMTYIDTEAAFADALAEQPEGVRIEIERTGSYTPSPRHIVSRLTERQREVLRAAVDLGYYQEPHEAPMKRSQRRPDSPKQPSASTSGRSRQPSFHHSTSAPPIAETTGCLEGLNEQIGRVITLAHRAYGPFQSYSEWMIESWFSLFVWWFYYGLHCHPDGSDDATTSIPMSSTKTKKRIYTNGL